MEVGFDDIASAYDVVSPWVIRTPLWEAPGLSDRLGRRVSVKLELFQRTGSFKPRGAIYQALGIPEGERASGMVGVSGGNFARGLAYAGQVLDIETTIVMPASAPPSSIEATRGYGAEAILTDTMTEAFQRVDEIADRGATKMHPFDHPRMIAGNGGVGLEIAEQAPDATDVLVSIGGGGFITGIATALGDHDARVWGVETEGADAMRRALDAGEPVRMEPTSIATTLSAPWVTERTLAGVRRFVEDVVVVSDALAVREVHSLAGELKILAEPAAACTLAAADELRERLGDHVVLVICGGNVSIGDVSGWTDLLL